MFTIRSKSSLLPLVLALSVAVSGCKQKPAEAPAPSDAALTAATQQAISGDSAIGTEPIQVAVSGGVVTLTGAVSNDAARSLAGRDAATVSGVHSVVNDLTVAAPVTSASVNTLPPPPVKTQPQRTPPQLIPPAPQRSAPIERNENQPPPQQQQQRAENRPAPPPPAPVRPSFKDITIPVGTTIPIRMTQTLDSATTQQGDAFSGAVAGDITVDGITVIPQGTAVAGKVDAVQEAAHFKGSSLLTIELTGVRHHGEMVAISTDEYSKQGNGRGKNTAEKIGGGAAVGAVLGGIFGGGKGAAIGAAAGGGAGAGVQGLTRGKQVQIPSESVVRFKLLTSVTLRVPANGAPPVGQSDGPALQHRNDQ